MSEDFAKRALDAATSGEPTDRFDLDQVVHSGRARRRRARIVAGAGGLALVGIIAVAGGAIVSNLGGGSASDAGAAATNEAAEPPMLGSSRNSADSPVDPSRGAAEVPGLAPGAPPGDGVPGETEPTGGAGPTGQPAKAFEPTQAIVAIAANLRDDVRVGVAPEVWTTASAGYELDVPIETGRGETTVTISLGEPGQCTVSGAGAALFTDPGALSDAVCAAWQATGYAAPLTAP